MTLRDPDPARSSRVLSGVECTAGKPAKCGRSPLGGRREVGAPSLFVERPRPAVTVLRRTEPVEDQRTAATECGSSGRRFGSSPRGRSGSTSSASERASGLNVGSVAPRSRLLRPELGAEGADVTKGGIQIGCGESGERASRTRDSGRSKRVWRAFAVVQRGNPARRGRACQAGGVIP